MDHVAVKLEQDLALMDEGNSEKQVRSRSMNQYGHMMI
jgi:cytochrome c-type biogenesis protein CcmH/NrfF